MTAIALRAGRKHACGFVLLPIPLVYFVEGLIFSAALTLSALGWGRLVCRILLGRVETDWPFQAAVGLSLVMSLGGLFTALTLVSRPLNFGVMALGLAAWVLLANPRAWLARGREVWRATPEWVLLLCFLGLLGLAQIVRSQYPVPWNQ